jgi:hypothetical protein
MVHLLRTRPNTIAEHVVAPPCKPYPATPPSPAHTFVCTYLRSHKARIPRHTRQAPGSRHLTRPQQGARLAMHRLLSHGAQMQPSTHRLLAATQQTHPHTQGLSACSRQSARGLQPPPRQHHHRWKTRWPTDSSSRPGGPSVMSYHHSTHHGVTHHR